MLNTRQIETWLRLKWLKVMFKIGPDDVLGALKINDI